MLTVVGLWLAIVGYGLAYSGMIQLGGGKCSLIDGFKGQCQPGGGTSQASSSGQTRAQLASASQQQQASMLPTVPISQGSTLA